MEKQSKISIIIASAYENTGHYFRGLLAGGDQAKEF
jgi:hypothetical protein